MVLTQPDVSITNVGGLILVSIPLWFLRNSRYSVWFCCNVIVSIPLWFLRNVQQLTNVANALNRFHTTMVLTQPVEGPCRGQTLIHCFHTTMVLTQHKNKPDSKNDSECFHTTMVLTQHSRLQLTLHYLTQRFHTTMVLTQQRTLNRGYPAFFIAFPYHYGSYATYGKARLFRPERLRFHTTMVLTQLLRTTFASFSSISSFHTTMVLTQRSSKKNDSR